MNVRRAILMMQLSQKQGNVCNTYKALLSRLYLRQTAKLIPECITQHSPLLFIPHRRNGQILLTLFINKVTKSQSDFFKDIIFKGNFVVFLSLICHSVCAIIHQNWCAILRGCKKAVPEFGLHFSIKCQKLELLLNFAHSSQLAEKSCMPLLRCRLSIKFENRF